MIGVRRRTDEQPCGVPGDDGEIPTKVRDETFLLEVTCKLARIKHEVGDAFTVEHIFPTPMLYMQCWIDLLSLPGIYIVTWDNCRYTLDVRHRQMMVTNCVWLVAISRDCRGSKLHRHYEIGWGAGQGPAK